MDGLAQLGEVRADVPADGSESDDEMHVSSAEVDFSAAGHGSGPSAVERAIRQERRLSTAQKEALISVYNGFLESGNEPGSSSEPG